MFNLGLRVVIYSLVTIVIVSVFFNLNTVKVRKDLTRQNYATLGNDLVAYFYFINTSLEENICQDIKKNGDYIVDQPYIKKIYVSFVCQKSDMILSYNTHYNAAWNQLEFDGTHKQNYLQYWQTIRPAIRKFYQENIVVENVSTPVIHFRCSDSPFNKHVQYHLPKEESVKWMAQQIKQRGFNKIIMLSCNQHFSLDKNSCAKYTDFYVDIFSAAGLEVVMQCSSIYQDFALMVNAPLLVSLNASSYSFMAGIAKDPKNYIACNMGIEIRGKYVLQNEADWITDHRKPLLHVEVDDYNDHAAVIKKLRS